MPDDPAPLPPGDPAPPVASFDDGGYLPPDPSEPPPVELWRTIDGVPPWGTVVLLLAWAVMFGRFALAGRIGDVDTAVAHGANLAEPPTWGSAWRLLASTFEHAGYGHLLFNAISMLVFGPAVERVFARPVFWIVYGLGGLAASLASVTWWLVREPGSAHTSIGASGAIFALVGALLVGAWRLRHRLAVGRARALAAAVLFFAAPSFVQGFHSPGTDNAAHVGGLVSGVALGWTLPLSPQLTGTRPARLMVALAALCALALASSFVRGLFGG